MKILLCYIALAFIPSVACSAEYLEQVESDVQEAKGTAQEIVARAKTCIAQNVQNNEVRISDNASSTGMLSGLAPSSGGNHSDGIEGRSVLVSVDPEQGSIIANNRIDYRSMMLAHNVKSTLTFMAKDGKFKMRHTNIEYLQKSTGSMHNSGYHQVGKWFGSGWKDAEAALNSVTDKVAQCVKADSVAGNW